MIRLLTPADEPQYDLMVRAHPHGTLWQSVARKKYLEACGKTVRLYVAENDSLVTASALVSIDRTAGGFSTWDLPRGPLWSDEEAATELLEYITHEAVNDRCLSLTISPVSMPKLGSAWQTSSRRVHAKATRLIDLTTDEPAILAQMHQKGRYNIGVAEKNSVTVRKGSLEDIEGFYALLQDTGGRDGFTISQKSHYSRFLSDLDSSFVFMAEHEGRPVSGLIGVIWNGTGIYYYGASSYTDRHLMAPYALQWAAMRFCKAEGCHTYDLLGISPDKAGPNDPWQGITEFKRKFGGKVVSYPPEHELVLRPFASALITLKRRLLG